MRALTIAGLILAGAAGVTAGQRPLQLELGGFASFTRYDRLMDIESNLGGGARVGFFISSRWSVEVDGGYQSSTAGATAQDVNLRIMGASLLYNIPSGGHVYYAAGGYSRLAFGPAAPYNFVDYGFHGAIGDRIFLSDRLALRVEVRAFYTPESGHPATTWAGHLVGSAGVSYFATSPTERARQYRAQAGDRHYQWYWGGQGGAFVYKTNLQPYYYDPVAGGHWLITKQKTSLYVALEQSWFLSDAVGRMDDPTSATGYRDVTFSDLRRIMFGVLAHPAERPIEPFVGAGFAIMQLLNPVADCSGTPCPAGDPAQENAELASGAAFFWLMGGIQINYSSKLNLFGHYILTSPPREFLLEGGTHSLQGGVRYSLGTSKEGLGSRD